MKKMILFLILLLLIGCERRTLIDPDLISLRLNINYTVAGIHPPGTTVWFFPHESSSGPIQFRTHDTVATVRLWPGAYSVLAINKTELDHSGINFRKMDDYYTAEVYGETRELPPAFIIPEYAAAIYEPDILTVDHIAELQITNDMEFTCKQPVLELKPQIVVPRVIMTVYIKGVKNLAQTGSYVLLNGIAQGYNFSTEITTAIPAAQLQELGNRSYNEGSTADGCVTASFNSFGTTSIQARSNSEISATLFLKLRNGTYFPAVSRVVTDKIVWDRSGGQALMYIYIGKGIDPGDEIITLPEVSDSGLDVNVDSWGKEIVIDIPI